MEDIQEREVVVIDAGSGSIKAGWAGEDAPRVVIPNLVLDASSQALPVGAISHASQKGVLFGVDAQKAVSASSGSGSTLYVNNPVKRGNVHDWDSMEKILEHVLTEELHLDSIDDVSVLITTNARSGAETRERLADILFRSFKVGSVGMANASILSLFSTGRTTGVVVDSGEGVTSTLPVFEGFALSHSFRQMDIAGSDITSYLKKVLVERGLKFDESNTDVVRDIKEKLCLVRSRGESKQNENKSADEDVVYELPDGQVIKVGRQCRYESTEILFNPSLIGKKDVGVHAMLHDSISSCDQFVTPTLCDNIVLAGGSTTMPGTFYCLL